MRVVMGKAWGDHVYVQKYSRPETDSEPLKTNLHGFLTRSSFNDDGAPGAAGPSCNETDEARDPPLEL